MKKAGFLFWPPRFAAFCRSRFSAIILFMMFVILAGCSYYKVKKTPLDEPSQARIEKLQPEERYVIIHSGSRMLHLNGVVVDDDNKELRGTLTTLDFPHRNDKPVHKKSHRYRSNEKEILNEVHFYTSQNLDLNPGEEVILPFSIVDSVSINKPDTGRVLVSVVGITVGVLVVTVAVIALTKSSCPFIYVKDGEEFIFRGELYPGAITPNIQRDDYIPLPGFMPSNGDYVIKVTNELHEIQNTDLLQMVMIKHPEEVQVLLDKEGKPHSFSRIEAPKRVFSDHLSVVHENILQQDNKTFLFDSNVKTEDGSRSLSLEFMRPAGAKQAKLFLTAKNSYWLDYTFGKFNEQFGSYYNTFQKQQLKTPGEESMQWSVDQNIPLSVYLKTKDGWKLVDRIPTVGPLAYRDLVVPIDLAEAQQEKVVLKLETGFMFWEIDRLGMDFSENIPMQEVVLEPSYAVDENGKNVTDLLRKTDMNYLVQPEVGNEVVVSFKSPQDPYTGGSTVFLKNRGYYTYIRDYKGLPKVAELRKFEKSGRFSLFSEESYRKFVEEEMLDLALTYGN